MAMFWDRGLLPAPECDTQHHGHAACSEVRDYNTAGRIPVSGGLLEVCARNQGARSMRGPPLAVMPRS